MSMYVPARSSRYFCLPIMHHDQAGCYTCSASLLPGVALQPSPQSSNSAPSHQGLYPCTSGCIASKIFAAGGGPMPLQLLPPSCPL